MSALELCPGCRRVLLNEFIIRGRTVRMSLAEYRVAFAGEPLDCDYCGYELA